MKSILFRIHRYTDFCLYVFICIFALWSWQILRSFVPHPAFDWMHVYTSDDFTSVLKTVHSLLSIRTGIPLGVAIYEIIELTLTGTLSFTIPYLYRIVLVASFCISIILSYRVNRLRGAASAILSVLFMRCWSHIAIGNPSAYDAYYSFYALGMIYCLSLASNTKNTRAAKYLLILSALFYVHLWFTRPYVMFISLIIIPLIFLKIKLSRCSALCFGLPFTIILIYHCYLFAAFGQFMWTNHSGFNLRNAWPIAVTQEEIDQQNIDIFPLGPILNTEQHTKESDYLKSVIVSYWKTHPDVFVVRLFYNAARYLSVPVKLFGNNPDLTIIDIYRVITMVLLCYVLFRFIELTSIACIKLLMKQRDELFHLITSSDYLILSIISTTFVLTIIGDRGEEARFILQLLPLLAFLPGTFNIQKAQQSVAGYRRQSASQPEP